MRTCVQTSSGLPHVIKGSIEQQATSQPSVTQTGIGEYSAAVDPYLQNAVSVCGGVTRCVVS